MIDQRQGAIAAIVRDFVAREGGRSVAVASLRGGTIAIGARADAVRPAASLLKIPLVAAVYDLADEGQLDLDESVARSELGSTAFGTVLSAFSEAHRFTIRELCALCIVASDNLAAEYLLGRTGMHAVNDTAAALAGPHTRMEVGFSDECLSTAGLANTTTARDALRMIRTVLSDPVRAPIASALKNNVRNPRIPLRLPQIRSASKTGTLYGVVNDVAVLFGAENDLALAFLCESQRDREATGLEIGDCFLSLWRALGDPNGSERRT